MGNTFKFESAEGESLRARKLNWLLAAVAKMLGIKRHYFGGMEEDPEQTPEEETLAKGDAYWRNSDNKPRVYDGTQWIDWPAGSGMQDPTTTKGDIVANNGTGLARIPVGADGKVLKADSGAANGVSWKDEYSYTLPETVAFTDVKQQFTKPQRGASSAVGASASITIDMDLTNHYRITGNTSTFQIENPSNILEGMEGFIILDLNGIKPTWGTYWNFGDAGEPTATSGRVFLNFFAVSTTELLCSYAQGY